MQYHKLLSINSCDKVIVGNRDAQRRCVNCKVDPILRPEVRQKYDVSFVPCFFVIRKAQIICNSCVREAQKDGLMALVAQHKGWWARPSISLLILFFYSPSNHKSAFSPRVIFGPGPRRSCDHRKRRGKPVSRACGRRRWWLKPGDCRWILMERHAMILS